MAKFILFPKDVQNMAGYIVENVAKLGYRDIVVGNPTDEPIKIDIPIYNEDIVKSYEQLGVVVYRMKTEESLIAALDKVKAIVKTDSLKDMNYNIPKAKKTKKK
ncbi:MAG: energy-converting hydrogenase B subunit EhbP [Candidatus Methanofastidiosa archaeon]|jgi:energy-converting hydrogenase B subunit P|nr:energy-converting hydrogenase B subunit EhbP [Candidatus Methanofastidiosa archaeon]